MPGTTKQIWVEFTPTSASGNPEIVRVFSSELTAWRTAGPNGNQAIDLHFGETLAEAIARWTTAKQTPAEQTAAVYKKASRDQIPGTASDPDGVMS